jgi:hypothetical protein
VTGNLSILLRGAKADHQPKEKGRAMRRAAFRRNDAA